MISHRNTTIGRVTFDQNISSIRQHWVDMIKIIYWNEKLLFSKSFPLCCYSLPLCGEMYAQLDQEFEKLVNYEQDPVYWLLMDGLYLVNNRIIWRHTKFLVKFRTYQELYKIFVDHIQQTYRKRSISGLKNPNCKTNQIIRVLLFLWISITKWRQRSKFSAKCIVHEPFAPPCHNITFWQSINWWRPIRLL